MRREQEDPIRELRQPRQESPVMVGLRITAIRRGAVPAELGL
jgi:hypothetical protein